MMKKTVLSSLKVIAVAAAAIVCGTALGRPHSGPAPRPAAPGPRIHRNAPMPRPHPLPARPHYHPSPAVPFWTGVGVGLVGSLLLPSPAPAPQPAVVIQAAPEAVWVPPVYGERPVYRAGIFVGMERYIITPGYWRR